MSVNLNVGGPAGGVGNGVRPGYGSIVGVFVGIVLVPVGFDLVWHAEGKLVE